MDAHSLDPRWQRLAIDREDVTFGDQPAEALRIAGHRRGVEKIHQFAVDHGTTGEGRRYGRPIFSLQSDKTGDDQGHRQPQVHLEAAPNMLDVIDPDVGVEKEMTMRRAGAERQTEYGGR